MVILHGGPDFDHAYLLPELDLLSDRFRLIYYDQRGRGRSAAGVQPEDITIASEVADLDALRQHLALETMALLGHSWGGLLALEYAVRHPQRLSALVLVDPAPASRLDYLTLRDARRQSIPEDLEKIKAIAATPAYQQGDLLAERDFYRLHFRLAVRQPELLESLLRRLRLHFTPQTVLQARLIEDRIYAETWGLRDYDLLPALKAVESPTLVLYGEQDIIPRECVAHIAHALPSARLVVLKDCGHFPSLDCPDAFRRAVDEFFG